MISLGGSIFSREEGVDIEYVKEFSNAILELAESNELFIVAGGGKTARRFINAGRNLGANEDLLDRLGIMATRLNALVVSAALGERGLDFVPERVEGTDDIGPDKIFVMGGTVPGHTTDAVSAMLAAHVNANLFINATNVDGVYEHDPRKNPRAKRFEKLTYDELLKIVKTDEYQAGTSTVIDPKAAKIIHENSIKTIILDGRKVENIVDAVKGEVRGTTVGQ